MSTAKGLGKDFSMLIPEDMLSEALAVGVSNDSIQTVPIQSLHPNPDQPRRHFEETTLNELAVSIKEHGIVQPLIVAKKGNDFIIIAGERRYKAAQIAGLSSVPVIVRSFGEQQKLEVALIENVQREDLTVLDLAAAYLRLHDQFNLSYDLVAKKVGKNPSTVNNIVRLLRLPLLAKKALHEKKIVEGHARQIVALKTEADQLKLLALILKHHWTVRQAEQYVVGHKKATQDEKVSVALKQTKNVTAETKQLEQQLKTPVKIRRLAKGGQLLISFKDDTQLKELIAEILRLRNSQ